MKISSTSIENGFFADRFGHRGTESIQGKMPSRSFQISWQDLPPNTRSLALIFIDHDSIPVCGMPWIHWTVANIDPALKELPENASIEMNLLQGVNSWMSGLLPEEWKLSPADATAFGGCAPPDKTHLYKVDVYALDTPLDLKPGFFENELLNAMEGHILAQAELRGFYKAKHE